MLGAADVARTAVKDLFLETTGTCYGDEEPCNWDDISWWDYPSMLSNDTHRITNVHWMMNPVGGYLTTLPVPLSFTITEDPDNDDVESWTVNNVV